MRNIVLRKMKTSSATNNEEMEEIDNRIKRLEIRGNQLKIREKQITSTVKYLLSKVREAKTSDFRRKVSDILMNYQDLHYRLQSLLQITLVPPQYEKQYQEHIRFLDETIIKIVEHEDKFNQIEKQLENRFNLEIIDDQDNFVFGS